MTKDEFLIMLNRELENLEKEYYTARKRVDYLSKTNSEELQEAIYQLNLVEKKLDTIKSLVNFPAYARIQAMSDIEVEKYRKDKISELELKVEELKTREKEASEQLSKLKAQQEELIKQFKQLSGRERENVIYRGRLLNIEISKYDINNQFGVFATIQKEMQEVRKLQEQIKNMTTIQIKDKLSNEIKESKYFEQTLKCSSEYVLDSSTKLLATVASDPKKAIQMADLLANYRRLSDEQKHIKGSLYLVWGLPYELKRKLIESSYYNLETKDLHNPDKLIEIIAEYEENFNQDKINFMNQFTPQKIYKLVGKEEGVDSIEVDMEFFKEHSDKLNDGSLEHLQSIVVQRDILSKKIFKTKNVRREIENLNSQIKSEQSNIYKKIIKWYKLLSQDILRINCEISFENLESLKQSLEKATQNIEQSQQSIIAIKQKIEEEKEKMEEQRKKYETIKAKVAQHIRTLGECEFMKTDILQASYRRESNLNIIADASVRTYKEGIISRVLTEAQKQADIEKGKLEMQQIRDLVLGTQSTVAAPHEIRK